MKSLLDDSTVTQQQVVDITKSSSLDSKPIIIETQTGSSLEPCLVQPTITYLTSINSQGTLHYKKLTIYISPYPYYR